MVALARLTDAPVVTEPVSWICWPFFAFTASAPAELKLGACTLVKLIEPVVAGTTLSMVKTGGERLALTLPATSVTVRLTASPAQAVAVQPVLLTFQVQVKPWPLT